MNLVDILKTGLRLKPGVRSRDAEILSGRRVAAMTVEGSNLRSNTNFLTHSDRDAHVRSRPFILDSLVAFGTSIATKHMVHIQRLVNLVGLKQDPEMVAVWQKAKHDASLAASGRYTIPSNQLQRIQEHVDSIHILWQPAVSDRSHNPVEGRAGLKRQILQDISQDFTEGPMGSAQFILIDVDAVKASYAYSLSPKFALSVAFRDVCTIKARSRGLYPMAQEFGQASDVGSSFVRAIKMKDE